MCIDREPMMNDAAETIGLKFAVSKNSSNGSKVITFIVQLLAMVSAVGVWIGLFHWFLGSAEEQRQMLQATTENRLVGFSQGASGWTVQLGDICDGDSSYRVGTGQLVLACITGPRRLREVTQAWDRAEGELFEGSPWATGSNPDVVYIKRPSIIGESIRFVRHDARRVSAVISWY
jgi:hypothetical protein